MCWEDRENNAIFFEFHSHRESVFQTSDKDFRIWVEDEGSGFDYESIRDDDQDFQYPEKKRGYLLINRLSDRIRFNEKGNRVTVYLKAKN